MALCAAIKRDGTRCKAQAVTGYDQCFAHSPELAEKRKKATSKGGRTGGKGRPKITPEDRLKQVFAVTDYLIPGLFEGQVDTRAAAAITAAGHLLLRAVETSLKIEEQRELRQQVEQLEDALEQERRTGVRPA